MNVRLYVVYMYYDLVLILYNFPSIATSVVAISDAKIISNQAILSKINKKFFCEKKTNMIHGDGHFRYFGMITFSTHRHIILKSLLI